MSEQFISAIDIRDIIAKSKLPVARGHQGDLYAAEMNGHRLIVKSAHGNFLSSWIRRRMLRREHRAYDRLKDVQGIPRCFGIYDGRYLVLEAIRGQTLRNAIVEDPERFYRMLFEIIEAMHSRGVAHGDLTRKDNILVDEENRPILVDFGVSSIFRRGWHPFNHLVFRFFSQHDLNAWLKYKYNRHRELMTPEDARYHRRLLLDEIARRIKRAFAQPRRSPAKRPLRQIPGAGTTKERGSANGSSR